MLRNIVLHGRYNLREVLPLSRYASRARVFDLRQPESGRIVAVPPLPCRAGAKSFNGRLRKTVYMGPEGWSLTRGSLPGGTGGSISPCSATLTRPSAGPSCVRVPQSGVPEAGGCRADTSATPLRMMVGTSKGGRTGRDPCEQVVTPDCHPVPRSESVKSGVVGTSCWGDPPWGPHFSRRGPSLTFPCLLLPP